MLPDRAGTGPEDQRDVNSPPYTIFLCERRINSQQYLEGIRMKSLEFESGMDNEKK